MTTGGVLLARRFFFQYEDVAIQALRNITHAVADAHAAQGLSA